MIIVILITLLLLTLLFNDLVIIVIVIFIIIVKVSLLLFTVFTIYINGDIEDKYLWVVDPYGVYGMRTWSPQSSVADRE